MRRAMPIVKIIAFFNLAGFSRDGNMFLQENFACSRGKEC
jgi:hypothetical protein